MWVLKKITIWFFFSNLVFIEKAHDKLYIALADYTKFDFKEQVLFNLKYLIFYLFYIFLNFNI